MKPRKTDYGTIVLHWLLVGAAGVAFVSGLRIATEAPDRTWLNLFDAILPRANVWTAHIEAAVVLVARGNRTCRLSLAKRPQPSRPARRGAAARACSARNSRGWVRSACC